MAAGLQSRRGDRQQWDWAKLGELVWEVRVRTQDRDQAKRLLDELKAAGRPTATDGGKRLMVGVAENEAHSLSDDLRLSAPFATITNRPMSRRRRWLIRQRLLGSYAGGGGDFPVGDGSGG
jgi:hypothetical protein